MVSSLMEMLLSQPSAVDKLMPLLSMTGGVSAPKSLRGLSTRDVSRGPGDPSQPPREWIDEALDITNKPAGWMDPLYDLMMRESGGDPRAINPNPVASGEHAKGLFQTIPSTFQAYNKASLGGIFDPVANAVAAIRYIKSRYGSPYNLPSSGGY